MASSKHATEDGWRELLNEQRLQPGQCDVTLAQLDASYRQHQVQLGSSE